MKCYHCDRDGAAGWRGIPLCARCLPEPEPAPPEPEPAVALTLRYNSQATSPAYCNPANAGYFSTASDSSSIPWYFTPRA